MSQVRKYQQGGAVKTPSPKTYGKFIKNGEEYEVTDDFMNQFDSWLSTQSSEVQNSLSPMRNNLKKGESINFDSFSQELSSNSDLPLKNDKQTARMKKTRSGFGKFLDAVTNNDVHKNAVAIDALRSFNYITPQAKPTEVDYYNYNVDYNTADDGSLLFSNSPANVAAKNRLSQFIDYQKMNEENRKNWNLKGFGQNGNVTLPELLKATSEQQIWDTWNRVETGTATEADWDVLRAFNIYDRLQTEKPEDTQISPEENAKQTIKNNGVDTEVANANGITLDENGNLDFSALKDNTVYLFSDYSPITSGDFYGGAYYNGKMYTKEEAEKDSELLQLTEAYRTNVNNGIYNDTANVVFNWGNEVSPEFYDPTKEYYGAFHDYLQPQEGKNRPYFWLNQAYDVDINKGEQMIATPDYESGRNPLTGYANKLQYLLYNPQTGVTSNTEPLRQQRLEIDSTQNYSKPQWGQRYKNGQRYVMLNDKDGYKFYRGEQDGQWYVQKGGSEDYFLVRNPEVAKRLMDGQAVTEDEITTMFKGSGSNRGKVLLEEDGYRHVRGSLKNWGKSPDWTTFISELNAAKQQTLGNNADGSPRSYQYGGALKTIKPMTAGTEIAKQELQSSVRDPRHTKIIGDGRGLSETDKLELAALGADLAGLGLSFIPGAGNIAGGVAGVGGTTMQFIADINKDGFDLSDAGSAALNLGLDAVTFIPGLGSAAKAGKVVRNIRRVGTTVLRGLALSGASNAAITAAQNIINGDKWTMDDLRTVVGGLQGITGLSRSVKTQLDNTETWKTSQNRAIKKQNKNTIEGNVTKTAKVKGLGETGNVADTDITLKMSKQEVSDFNKLKTQNEKSNFIKKVILDKNNFAIDDDVDILKTFDLPTDKRLEFKGKGITVKKGTLQGDTKKQLLTNWQAFNQVSPGINFRNTKVKNKALETTQAKQNRAFTKDLKNKKYPWMYELGQSDLRSLGGDYGNESQEALYRYQDWKNQYSAYKLGGKISKFQSGGKMRLEDMGQIPDYKNVLTNFGKQYFTQDDLDALNAQHASRLNIGNQMVGNKVGTFQTDFNKPLFTDIIKHVANTEGYGKTTKAKYEPMQNGYYNVDNRMGGVTRSWVAGSEALQKYFTPSETSTNVSNIMFDDNNGKYIFKPTDSQVGPVAQNKQSGYTPSETTFTGRYQPKNYTTENPTVVGQATPDVFPATTSPRVPVLNTSPQSAVNKVTGNIEPLAKDLSTTTAQRSLQLPSIGSLSTNKVPTENNMMRNVTQEVENENENENNKGGFLKLGTFGVDPDNLMALGNLASAIGYNNKIANVNKHAIDVAKGALESAPLEIYPRFSDYGISGNYQNAIRQQLSVKPATSDALLSHAIEQDAKNRASNLQLEGNMKVSEQFSRYLDNTNELRRNYAGLRTDVANRNRQRLAQLAGSEAQVESGRLANQYMSINNFILEKRNRLAQDKVIHNAFTDQLANNKIAQEQQVAYTNALQPFKNQFEQLSSDDQTKYGNVETWLQQTNPGQFKLLQNQLSTINENTLKQYGNNRLDYYNTNNKYPNAKGWNNLFNPFSYSTKSLASGGTLTRLNAAEHIWKEQNKEVADAVKQLNKNMIALFLKATT